MAIKCTNNDLHAVAREQIERIHKAVLYNLAYIGETAVKTARENGSYTDRTGNLRSSTGYVLIYNGQILQQGGFAAVKQGANGSNTGEQFAKSLVKQYPLGYALVVVAGMEYAGYVSAKGYDVLDSAELIAEQLANRLLAKLAKQTIV